MNKKSGLVLLSGGLDSLVSIKKSNCNIKLGLLFDYGQIAYLQEKKAAKKIADFYNFPLEIIKLNWLKNITSNSLTDKEKNKKLSLKDLNNKKELKNSMKSVWIPNRNSLFINIAASYCEAKNIDTIIIGANREESKTFKDNSKEFIRKSNELLNEATNKKIEVVAPLIDMDKKDIVKYGLDNKIPLDIIYSCYKGEKKHCGICESCLHLKCALIENGGKNLIKKFF